MPNDRASLEGRRNGDDQQQKRHNGFSSLLCVLSISEAKASLSFLRFFFACPSVYYYMPACPPIIIHNRSAGIITLSLGRYHWLLCLIHPVYYLDKKGDLELQLIR